MGPKQLKYTSSACFVIGFLIPFLASSYIGMSLTAMPIVTVATIGLWIIGLLLRYHAYLGTAKPPATLAFRMRLGNFISSEPSLFLTLGIVFGYLYYPSVEKSVVPTVGPYLLMIIMFTMGLAINLKEWLRMLQKPKVVGLAVLLRWACMPLVAFLLSLVFIQLFPGATGYALAMGMIVLGTTPTGGGSNALTLISKGDLALSVSATAINTILAPLIQPILILCMAQWIANMDAPLMGKLLNTSVAKAIFLDLLWMVVAPVVAGTILGSIFPKAVARIKSLFGPLAIICLSFIVMGTMSRGTSKLIEQASILIYLVVICLVQAVAGLSLGYFLPKYFGFNYAQRKAACFEVGVENAAMAMLIALRHFSPLTALPSIVYGKIQYIITSTIVVSRFQAIEDKEVIELAATPVPAPGVATVKATVPDRSEGERP